MANNNETYCVRHPTTATNLSCGRCGEMICPRCLVHAPVGLRCPDCAQVKPIPTYDVSGAYLARAIGVGVALAIVGGAVVVFLTYLFSSALVYMALIVLLGYVTGEAISVATNRKRGGRLKIVAGGTMFVAITVATLFTGVTFSTMPLLASGVGFYMSVSRF